VNHFPIPIFTPLPSFLASGRENAREKKERRKERDNYQCSKEGFHVKQTADVPPHTSHNNPLILAPTPNTNNRSTKNTTPITHHHSLLIGEYSKILKLHKPHIAAHIRALPHLTIRVLSLLGQEPVMGLHHHVKP